MVIKFNYVVKCNFDAERVDCPVVITVSVCLTYLMKATENPESW